jgi:hypothetical protein
MLTTAAFFCFTLLLTSGLASVTQLWYTLLLQQENFFIVSRRHLFQRLMTGFEVINDIPNYVN